MCAYYNSSSGMLVKKRWKFVAKSIRRFRVTLYSGEENPLEEAEGATWEEVLEEAGAEGEQEVGSGGSDLGGSIHLITPVVVKG